MIFYPQMFFLFFRYNRLHKDTFMKRKRAAHKKQRKNSQTVLLPLVKKVFRFIANLFWEPSLQTRRTTRKKNFRGEKTGIKSSPLGYILEKASDNPIIAPRDENGWEAWQTFNPGAVLIGNDIHFLYRAVGNDGVSRLGYAVSRDGLTIDDRLTYPVYEHAANGGPYVLYSYASGGSWGGAEDPRMVYMADENTLYMTYTACASDGLRVGLTSISIQDFLDRNWQWNPPILLSPPGQVHKNWVLFPEKIKGKYAVLHSINPTVSIATFDSFSANAPHIIPSTFGGYIPRRGAWDKWVRGAGPAPLKTKHGWLLLYHAMDNDRSKYRVGAMLLDLRNPAKILHRASAPVLEPTEHYENNGSKSGVVYASATLVKDGTLFVYYGGADSYVCAATADFDEFMSALLKDKPPALKKQRMVRRKK
ncbi:MAG: putative glycosidase ph1107 protein [Parcubacteria group bacterium Gr01-1014_70]|nr:MAG: putative glycosidase ph1107 protein [Parcubacteria group bacterium Gr01-1014_70]